MTGGAKAFCFWEPAGSMPAYLRMCMETWALALGDREIVGLGDSNLDQYLPRGTYDAEGFRRLTPAMRKEAISVAVLHRFGGLFLDVDTLFLDDPAPLLHRLRRTELMLFNRHLAFMAARPGAQVLSAWLSKIQRRLERLGAEEANAELPWSLIGNDLLDEVLADLAGVPRPVSSTGVESSANPSLLGRLRRKVMIELVHRRRIEILPRDRYGFIAEAVHRPDPAVVGNPRDEYCEFWFTNRVSPADVLARKPMVIGLHNSWTPQWYKDLSEDGVLEQDCLLSKLLRQVLKAG